MKQKEKKKVAVFWKKYRKDNASLRNCGISDTLSWSVSAGSLSTSIGKTIEWGQEDYALLLSSYMAPHSINFRGIDLQLPSPRSQMCMSLIFLGTRLFNLVTLKGRIGEKICRQLLLDVLSWSLIRYSKKVCSSLVIPILKWRLVKTSVKINSHYV